MVIANGGKIGGVTKSLNYLVCNSQNDGSSKTNKAIQLGVKMITEDEFLMRVGERYHNLLEKNLINKKGNKIKFNASNIRSYKI